jgi:hypothetical protein
LATKFFEFFDVSCSTAWTTANGGAGGSGGMIASEALSAARASSSRAFSLSPSGVSCPHRSLARCHLSQTPIGHGM